MTRALILLALLLTACANPELTKFLPPYNATNAANP